MSRARIFATGVAALALGGACGTSATPDGGTPAAAAWQGKLDVDIRDSVSVRFAVPATGDTASYDATLGFSAGYQLLDATRPLTGTVRIERFPEASLVLYTAKWSAPAQAAGPCGAQPVSLALALTRRGANDRVGGSLTAYCGANTWSGTPARVLRLMGSLPKGS